MREEDRVREGENNGHESERIGIVVMTAIGVGDTIHYYNALSFWIFVSSAREVTDLEMAAT